jgi:SAM-dependent methyltransferase
MADASDSRSYNHIPDFGLLYDSVPAYAQRTDVPFYVAEALRADGAVLELGCGTGRVLLPIARAGATVVGLDGSHEMLARCRAKLLAESDATRARVALHHGDARSFELATTFAIVIAPFRMLQHLVSIEDQLHCLEAVRRHLAPGGHFVFDVFNPHFGLMTADRSAEQEETPEQSLGDGRVLRRTYRVPRIRWLDQVSETELIYYVAERPGEPAQRYVHGFDMRWYLRAELIHLLARSGFRVHEIFGDFDRSPLTDRSPELILCAGRT